jgi:RNA polymerase sigma-70 factor (ECF subfamily)
VVAAVEAAFREHWPRVLATLIGLLGDFELAEEAAQDAFAIAAARWPRDGTPQSPAAWLTVTGRNRASNRIRRDRLHADKSRVWRRRWSAPGTTRTLSRSSQTSGWS